MKPPRGRLLQAFRVAQVIGIAVLIHWQHQKFVLARSAVRPEAEIRQAVTGQFGDSCQLIAPDDEPGLTAVMNADGQLVGFVARTMPLCRGIPGFSGPTDVLVLLDADQRIARVELLSSGDTREHVEQVRRSDTFLRSFIGIDGQHPESVAAIDAVSGATLTSVAVQESVRLRLAVAGGIPTAAAKSLRFPSPPQAAELSRWFPDAADVSLTSGSASAWTVTDSQSRPVGTLIRTSPAADHIVGFQGPTDTLLVLDTQDQIQGVLVSTSYDNEPYVGYVRDDAYFARLFTGRTLAELAHADLRAERVEGVSGATMTSMAVANGIVAAAAARLQELSRPATTASPMASIGFGPRLFTLRNVSTAVIAALGFAMGLTHWRRHHNLRRVFQAVFVVWLGLINGDLVSQALLLGWAQSGMAWRSAFGLSLLTMAALLVPVVTGHNVYCSHVCPHGAVQQWLKNRLPWRLRLSTTVRRSLRVVPALLLIWVMLIGLCHLPFSAVDIEPFDAWLITIAGAATLVVAIGGLAASLFVPMAYCRFGCPTGALLDFVRFSRHDRPGLRDLTSLTMVIVAVILTIGS